MNIDNVYYRNVEAKQLISVVQSLAVLDIRLSVIDVINCIELIKLNDINKCLSNEIIVFLTTRNVKTVTNNNFRKLNNSDETPNFMMN